MEHAHHGRWMVAPWVWRESWIAGTHHTSVDELHIAPQPTNWSALMKVVLLAWTGLRKEHGVCGGNLDNCHKLSAWPGFILLKVNNLFPAV